MPKVEFDDTFVSVSLSRNDTKKWANKTNSVWPCSFISGRSLWAVFDRQGLVDLSVNYRRGKQDFSSDEFNAITSDFIGQYLPKEHDLYFVTVGQFK